MAVDVIILTGISGNEFQRAIGAYRIASHLRQHGYTTQVIDFVDEFEWRPARLPGGGPSACQR
jgi:hypothetical protein